jgi:hypothetical protein
LQAGLHAAISPTLCPVTGFTVLIKRAEKKREPEESPQMNWVFRRNERLFRPALLITDGQSLVAAATATV